MKTLWLQLRPGDILVRKPDADKECCASILVIGRTTTKVICLASGDHPDQPEHETVAWEPHREEEFRRDFHLLEVDK